jgi:hypothetical protein
MYLFFRQTMLGFVDGFPPGLLSGLTVLDIYIAAAWSVRTSSLKYHGVINRDRHSRVICRSRIYLQTKVNQISLYATNGELILILSRSTGGSGSPRGDEDELSHDRK